MHSTVCNRCVVGCSRFVVGLPLVFSRCAVGFSRCAVDVLKQLPANFIINLLLSSLTLEHTELYTELHGRITLKSVK